MEQPLEGAWVGPQDGWGKVSGCHQGGQRVFARLMETQICLLPLSAHREMEGLNKELMDSSCTSIWDKAPPSMLFLKLDILVSPWTSLAPFELLPQPCSSEEVSSSASKSACRLFKRNT